MLESSIDARGVAGSNPDRPFGFYLENHRVTFGNQALTNDSILRTSRPYIVTKPNIAMPFNTRNHNHALSTLYSPTFGAWSPIILFIIPSKTQYNSTGKYLREFWHAINTTVLT